MPRQLDFFQAIPRAKLQDHARRIEHGGDKRKGRRKLARPIDPKRPMHVVLHASRAKGDWSMLRLQNERAIKRIIWTAAANHGIRVYQFANVGNHLHLLVKTRTRQGFQDFARTISALIARAVTGAKKGNPVGKFWDELLYSKVLEWGRVFFNAKYYVIQNELETLDWMGCERTRPRPPPRGGARR
jgi:hypothetical protein